MLKDDKYQGGRNYRHIVCTRSLRMAERGSVLVVCLGILVIMALMATAFLSSVTLRRDAGQNLMAASQAEMAALAGKAHVLRVLDDSAKVGNPIALNQDWYLDFTQLGAGLTTSDTLDMWAPIWPNIGAATNVTGAIGATLDYIGIPGLGGTMPKQVTAKWFTLGYLDRNRKRFSSASDAANFPIEIRYATAIRDLSGLWPANGSDATTISMLMSDAGMATNADKLGLVCSTAAGLEFAGSAQAVSNFSWEQIRGSFAKSANADLDDKYRMLITPFLTRGNEANIVVNVNTAPFMVLKAMLKVDASYEDNANTAAADIVRSRGGYTSVNDVKNAASVLDDTIGILFNGSARGRWDVGPSNGSMFHAIIRGQVYDTLRLMPIAEANLEIVYCNKSTSKRILYQRWVSKTR